MASSTAPRASFVVPWSAWHAEGERRLVVPDAWQVTVHEPHGGDAVVAQDEVVQASVLGLLSQETLGDLSQALLKRLASGTGGPPAGGGGTRAGRSGGGSRTKPAPRPTEPEGRLLEQ